MSTTPIMGHLVLGYPSLSVSLETAKSYIAAGVQILELQIPFSHPTADGPVITVACQAATKQGVRVQDCIAAIAEIRAAYPTQEIMVMSYINRIYAFGIQAFMDEMQNLGIRHLIIPDYPADLPLGTPSANAPRMVPVLAANISEARLEKILALNFDFYYLMSDFKITGSGFSLHPQLQSLIKRIKHRHHQARIGIGFGISTRAQAKLVTESADYAIIGSALIQAQQAGNLEAYFLQLSV
jgi:tryptophan synthase alpha chain